MILTPTQLAQVRSQPQQTRMYLSIYRPSTIFTCQANGNIAKGETQPTYTNYSGTYSDVLPGMTLLVGSSKGAQDLGRVRIKGVTGTYFDVGENSDVQWASGAWMTAINFMEIWPVYPKVALVGDTDYWWKDGDITYTDQGTKLGCIQCIGPNRAAMIDGSGVATLYFSATGTVDMHGAAITYAWEFEGGTPSTHASGTPGNVTWDTPGHYRVHCRATANGVNNDTYRFVSIYGGSLTPITQFELKAFSGSRSEGGYNGRIRVYQDLTDIQDGTIVVLFTDDWYGPNHVSLGGNAVGNSRIFFSGYILKDSITYDYKEKWTEFDVGTASMVMKNTEAFAVSCTSKSSPAVWDDIEDLNPLRALFYYMRWHSTLLRVCDFQYTGPDLQVQYFDTDRQSLYDAIATFMGNSLYGELVSDRQGKLWAEISVAATHNATGTIANSMNLSKRDWVGSPRIDEQPFPVTSYLECGGVYYSGPDTNTYSNLLACAPGDAPGYRGKVDRHMGLIISGQPGLNDLAGDVFAYTNSRYSLSLNLAGSYRNLDIAPNEIIGMNVSADDTTRGIVFSDSPFHITEMTWTYNGERASLLPTSTLLKQVTAGVAGSTIPIEAIAPDTGFQVPTFTIPSFTFPSFPSFRMGAEYAFVNWTSVGPIYSEGYNGTSVIYTASHTIKILKTGWYFVNIQFVESITIAVGNIWGGIQVSPTLDGNPVTNDNWGTVAWVTDKDPANLQCSAQYGRLMLLNAGAELDIHRDFWRSGVGVITYVDNFFFFTVWRMDG